MNIRMPGISVTEVNVTINVKTEVDASGKVTRTETTVTTAPNIETLKEHDKHHRPVISRDEFGHSSLWEQIFGKTR